MAIFTVFVISLVLLIVAVVALAMRGNYDNVSFTLLGLMGGFTIGCIVGVGVF